MTEAQLAAESGIMKRHLAEIRRAEFTLNIEFEKKGRQIVYTPEGIEKMKARLASGNVRAGASDETKGGKADDDVIADKALTEATEDFEQQRRTLIVVRLPTNPRIALCKVEGTGMEARCRVASTKNLLPGMEIENCLHIRGDYFEFTGKLPRSRGNWRRRTTATKTTTQKKTT